MLPRPGSARTEEIIDALTPPPEYVAPIRKPYPRGMLPQQAQQLPDQQEELSEADRLFRLPPEHAAVFVPVLVCTRRIVQAHAAATAAASAASKAASDATAASAAVEAAAGGGGGEGTGPADAAWSAAVRPLPAEYLPRDLRPESAPASSGPLTSAQLSSRLCSLVGEAFLARAGWWPAVFIRHFIDERDLEKLHPVDLEKLLERVHHGRGATPY